MMTSIAIAALPPLAVGSVAMFLLWRRQLKTRDATSVDLAWTILIGVTAVWIAMVASGDPVRRVALAAMVGFWSLRLASHLVPRVGAGSEDGRYSHLREEFGERADRFFFAFFQGQAVLAIILSAPFWLVANDPTPLFGATHAVTDIAGIVLFAVALAGESIADRQLHAFASDPDNRGRTCRRGLWRYSRHPNYFFEWLVWCAFALFALGAPYGVVGLVSPAIMLWLITCVTGIPPAEARSLERRGDDYREYQRTTSAFVPWFPAREASR